MLESIKKKLKLLVVIAIAGFLVWFFVISPMITFKSNEDRMEKAARRYYELNSNKLPTGERIGTVTLSTLYHEAYIDKDLFIPHSKKTCSVSDSWVKVRKENGEYKYYVYLECGVMKSSIDHKGPEIKLNGDNEITVGLGEEFKDPGIKSVVDNKDGKLKIDDVEVKGTVNTSKMGSYEIKYVAFDNLNNKTTVVRTVTVVQKLNSTVKKALGDSKNYVGADPENYIYFSNNLFRIVGLDGNNVKIIANEDVANVGYNSIDEWFKYYDEHLTDSAKKIIVKSKFCNMKINDSTLDTTECNSYSKKKSYGLISIDELNRANTDEGNFLNTFTISWLANGKDDKNSYTVRNNFFESDKSAMSFENKHNFGVRPVIVINGDTLITAGDGSYNNPYYLEDYVPVKKNDLVNSRYSGEYINYSGYLWRISEVLEDGTVKVIMNQSLYSIDGELIEINYEKGDKLYNPTKTGNIGYIINNNVSKYIDTKYFVNHEIVVPIYKNEPSYNGEIDKKVYSAKISAPNIYDLYSAYSFTSESRSYWTINSSKNKNEYNAVSDIGVVMYGPASTQYNYGIKPVGYLNKNCFITSGKGTITNPYVISK